VAASAQIKKVSPWHERLADALIARPDVSMGELAKEFGVTPAWLSTVKNSDAFQEFFRRRSDAHSNQLLHDVRDRAIGAADQAIEEIQKRLDQNGSVMPFDSLLETADVMLKRAGFGSSGLKQNQNQAPTVNVIISREELAELRRGIREQAAPILIEATVAGTGDGKESESGSSS
jgi:hypothetical protein